MCEFFSGHPVEKSDYLHLWGFFGVGFFWFTLYTCSLNHANQINKRACCSFSLRFSKLGLCGYYNNGCRKWKILQRDPASDILTVLWIHKILITYQSKMAKCLCLSRWFLLTISCNIKWVLIGLETWCFVTHGQRFFRLALHKVYHKVN